MKTVIISILIFFTVNAQNIWYVDKNATGGSDNGTSWANAWLDFGNGGWEGESEGIDWSLISAGDTIYVSGGSTSKTYYGVVMRGDSPISFASGNPVVITPAWHSGHNGDVIFEPSTSTSSWIITFMTYSNVELNNITINDTRTSGSGIMQVGGADTGDIDSLQFLLNCHIIGRGITDGLYLSGSKITVRNCMIENLQNSTANDQDLLTMSAGRGGHTIDHCIIIYRNDNEVTQAHRDGIQISNVGEFTSERLTTTISNSLIIYTNEDGTEMNNIFYNYGALGNAEMRLLVYNNIFVNRKNNSPLGVLGIGRNYITPYEQYLSLYILNNTFIGKSSGGISTPVTAWAIDTLVMKNNIIIADTTVNNMLNFENSEALWDAVVRDIDYNFYAEYGGINPAVQFAVTGNNKTFNDWLAEGWDAHGITGANTDVTFNNKYGLDKADYYTETGRDAGVDLSNEFPFLAYDILGNPRSGSWDMGALEFVGSPPSGINVKSKIFLQGPFSTNSMSTTLTQSSLLPNSQPYNTSPWNYTGNESFSSGPSPTMVDWVLVELRSASNPSQVIARRAAVLKNNGLLLNTYGTEGVNFSNVDPGSYYIAIYHRNHLAIMSATPVPLSLSSTLYDFTTGMNKAYGQNPMVELAPGKYGMYATDGNADGIVNIADRDDVWLIQNGSMGYLEGDFDMNSGVTVHDVNQLWNINNGAVTQVP